MNTPEAVEVEGVLIKPHDLHDFVLPAAPCPAKKPWSISASRLSGRASPLDAGPFTSALAGRIRTATDQPLVGSDQFIACRVADAMATHRRVATKS